MKKILSVLLIALLAMGMFVGCSGKDSSSSSSAVSSSSSTSSSVKAESSSASSEEKTEAEATVEPGSYHIGIVTGTVSQSEDDLRGAEALIAKYGAVADGGMIQHVTYPDNFMEEQETTISVIAGLADDPLMKAVIVNQSVPGTTEAFRRIKEKNPDILCIAGEAHEDPATITSAADLVVNNDFVSRGYLIINTAHELGCDTFVHISFPRHLSQENMSRRLAIMKDTCNSLGMEFVSMTAPDPTSDVGIAGAQQYVLENVPSWIEQYGPNTAFFCTNDAHTEPLLRQLMEYGGYFIEADLPSPLMGYPGALGIDFSDVSGDFPAILSRLEEEVVSRGGEGRFGTWAYSLGYTTTAGLGSHAMNVIEGRSKLNSIADLREAYAEFTPGATWNGAYYTDVNTGVTNQKMVLVYQDTYILGKGYMGVTDVEIPEKCYTLK